MNNRAFNIYSFMLIVYFLQSLAVWFLWGDFFKVLVPLLFVIASFFNHSKNVWIYKKSTNSFVVFLLFIILIIGVRDSGILSILKKIILCYAFYDILSLKHQYQAKILIIITKVFGTITAISLLWWFLFLLNIPLPYSELDDPVYDYTFHNYYLFLHSYKLLFPRFHSIFLEPGHFAMIAAPIVYANSFNLKNKYVLAIFLGILFSTSIAGYVILLFSAFFYFGKKTIIVISVLIVTGTSCGVVYFNKNSQENSAIYHLIFRRLQVQDGDIVANDRFSDDLNEFFYEKFTKSSDKYFGLAGQTQKMKWDGGNAGYKLYIIENGYVGLFLTFIVYWLIMAKSPSPPFLKYGYFFIHVALFLQASYPFWFGVFTLYIIGLTCLGADLKDYQIAQINPCREKSSN